MTDEELQFETESARLIANFGDKLGKHGALSACRVPVMVRVSRDANLRLANLSRRLNLKKAALVGQVVEVFSQVEAERYFAALVAVQRAGLLTKTELLARPVAETDCRAVCR